MINMPEDILLILATDGSSAVCSPSSYTIVLSIL
jgi:hypothetical protein